MAVTPAGGSRRTADLVSGQRGVLLSFLTFGQREQVRPTVPVRIESIGVMSGGWYSGAIPEKVAKTRMFTIYTIKVRDCANLRRARRRRGLRPSITGGILCHVSSRIS